MKNLSALSLKARRLRFARGFSLPEVTLALGIAAMGLTSILGLLPQGIDNLRKAGDVAASARISQQILGSLNQEPWQDTTVKRRYYYNAYAIPLDVTKHGTNDVAYVAEVSLATPTVSLPGTAVDPYLKRVVMKMKQTPYPDFDFDTAAPANYGLYSYVVAQTGK